jgi:DNA-binding transcriptional ArsR family regulator
LTIQFVNTILNPVLDVQVIDQPAVALAALDPVRARVLAALVEPGSATTVAAAIGLPRQQVNYHVRTLESHGLVRLVEERPRRGLVERVVQASAAGFVLSPTVLGPLAADPDRTDRLSARYLIALAARAVREVAELSLRATRAGKALPTLAVDTEVRFASAAARAAFTRQLATAVADLVATYHDETAPGGRRHRLVVLAHPTPAAGRSDAPGGTHE